MSTHPRTLSSDLAMIAAVLCVLHSLQESGDGAWPGNALSNADTAPCRRYLKARLADKGGNIRDTASEVTGSLAKNYVDLKGQPLPCTHPIMQIALDAIVAQGRELSTAGGVALACMSSYVGPLDQDMLKHFLKLLCTDNFMSKQHLLQAFATFDPDTQRASGFIIRGLKSIQPAIGALIGVQKTPTKAGPRHVASSLSASTAT